MADDESIPSNESTEGGARSTRTRKSLAKRKSVEKKELPANRTRAARPYPASSFNEAAPLGIAIHQYASGQRVRRLTLLKQMEKSPTSGPTKQLITNSGKYRITTGSYAAEWLALTQTGSTATEPGPLTKVKLEAQFSLAVQGVAPFGALYEEYKSKKLPSQDVMKDFLSESGIPSELLQECVDTFIVNTKDLGLIQTLGGSETLFPIESRLDEFSTESQVDRGSKNHGNVATTPTGALSSSGTENGKTDWSSVCFVITPIGEEGSEQRRHADLFLSSLIEPALKESGLKVLRADKIGASGMITSQVLEHVMRSRLAVVDLSFTILTPSTKWRFATRAGCRLSS